MGSCISTADKSGGQNKRVIRRYGYDTDALKTDGQLVNKVLLLGAGESGKSTVVRQMKIIYSGGFSYEELNEYKPTVLANLVTSMQVVLNGAGAMKIHLDQSDSLQHARVILAATDPVDDNGDLLPDLRLSLDQLWKDSGVRESFKKAHEYELNDSAPYYFSQMQRILRDDYRPNMEDVLRARVRTTGISDTEFIAKGVLFKIIDVGGQRSERRKWIQCFEDVKTVLFVCAISGYDMHLYEDETQNRLSESLELFKAISNNRFFLDASMVLFLNKMDLFRHKIMNTQNQLKRYFPEYEGPAFNVDEASKYIQNEFFKRKPYPSQVVHMHYTMATDTGKMKAVFDNVLESIVKDTLSRIGNNLQ